MVMPGDIVGMVLCAGLGTRLRPLTWLLPKPAAPVCGVPLVRYAFALLAGAGIRRVVVNAHHLAERMAVVSAASARATGLDLAVSREPVIAGTGGALREARQALAGAAAIVVVNGDVLFDLDLAAALAAHRASGALATMVLMPMPPGASYAPVETDDGGAVRRIAGIGPGGERLTPWHFTGVHVVAPELLHRIPAAPFEVDVNRHVYPPILAEGLVRGHRAGGYWNDLGTPGRYLSANEDVLARRVSLARFRGCDPFAGLERSGPPGVWTGPGASVHPGAILRPPVLVGAGARLEAGATAGPLAIVGDRARVASGAKIAHAVVWDDTALHPGEEVVRAVAAGGDRVSAAEG
jgi:mannose-1-phosphate guanylyltransferase